MTLGHLPRMSPQKIGQLTVHACLDSAGPTRPPEDLLRGLPDDRTDPDWLAPYFSDDGRMLLAYQSFVLRLGDRVIVVDCAVGEDGEFPMRPDWDRKKSNWLAHLGQAGVTPDEVDTVFLTHLHVDHTGWLTRLEGDVWSPTFANARHLTTKVEHDFWLARHQDFPYMGASVRDSVTPVVEAGLFDFVEAGDEVAPGLTVVDLAGHSPGMIGLEYREDGKLLAAFNADLMHHPLQMAFPEVTTLFCADADRASAVRQEKLAEYADAGTIMFCNHFPGESAGLSERDGVGYRFVPTS
ncbi:MAG: MBL fold metallo-hydrolase [Paracoccaceae bacterium]|nr:MBL fold metallo-hydrolase [Paracoccaceae bacterium]